MSACSVRPRRKRRIFWVKCVSLVKIGLDKLDAMNQEGEEKKKIVLPEYKTKQKVHVGVGSLLRRLIFFVSPLKIVLSTPRDGLRQKIFHPHAILSC